MNEYRTYNCGELRINNVGENVKLAGWVQKIRNLGSMIFIDLRDEFGITQIIISDKDSFEDKLSNINTECTISIEGEVSERSNKNKE